jgi:hypothetical protein
MIYLEDPITIFSKSKPNQRKRGPREFGPEWSVIFIPLLFLAAGLSIPYTKYRQLQIRRRERRFAEQMRLAGRVIDGADCIPRLVRGEGTLILESMGYKKETHWWWTPDEVEDSRRIRCFEGMTPVSASEFSAHDDWHREHYTGPNGSALLIIATSEPRLQLAPAMRNLENPFLESVRWVEIGPSVRRILAQPSSEPAEIIR